MSKYRMFEYDYVDKYGRPATIWAVESKRKMLGPGHYVKRENEDTTYYVRTKPTDSSYHGTAHYKFGSAETALDFILKFVNRARRRQFLRQAKDRVARQPHKTTRARARREY